MALEAGTHIGVKHVLGGLGRVPLLDEERPPGPLVPSHAVVGGASLQNYRLCRNFLRNGNRKLYSITINLSR